MEDMDMTTYRVTLDGDELFTFDADLTDAAAPILFNGEPTPFQTADAKHYANRAACLLIEWLADEGGPVCDAVNDNWEVE